MLGQYFPILMFIGVGLGLGVLLPLLGGGASRLLGVHRPDPEKLSPYECGIAAPTEAFDHRFSVRYYLIAVLFVVFDVETVFLFAWAVMYDKLLLFGLVEMVVFIYILVVGYVYVWKRGALSWA